MRRTTQWAVFTTMNQRRTSWRLLYENADDASSGSDGADTTASVAATEPESRSAPDTRRDRVDFM